MSFWDDHQGQLELLAADGFTGGEIARILGTTRNAVMGRAHRTGVRLPVTARKTEEAAIRCGEMRRSEWADPEHRARRLASMAAARSTKAA